MKDQNPRNFSLHKKARSTRKKKIQSNQKVDWLKAITKKNNNKRSKLTKTATTTTTATTKYTLRTSFTTVLVPLTLTKPYFKVFILIFLHASAGEQSSSQKPAQNQ